MTILDIVNYDVRLRDNYDGRRIKVWRAERVRELILGGLRKSADTPVEA